MLWQSYLRLIKLTKTKSLKAGSIWTLLGFGGETFLRMLSSLILTRIFLPDVFGIMAIVTAIMVGMEMLSEVGVRPSLIQNPNARTPEFAQTAWTLQILRGILLWINVFLFADVIADYFDEPMLTELLPIAAVALIFKGFISTNQYLYSRELGVAKIISSKLLVQVLSLCLIVILALMYKSIWAIVIGSLFSALLSTIFSFFLFKNFTMKLRLDKQVMQSIFKLGKWLFLATIFHFLISHGDKLLLGGLISLTELGLYNLAAMFTQIPISILSALSGQILMPYFAKSYNDNPEYFNKSYNEVLEKILSSIFPIIAVLALFGNSIIQFLYPSSFHLAGKILQLLAVASFFQVISFALIPIFLARGDSFRHMLAYLSLLTLYLPAIYLGFEIYGMWGSFYGMFMAQFLWLPIVIILTNTYIKLDVLIITKKLGFYLLITVGLIFINERFIT